MPRSDTRIRLLAAACAAVLSLSVANAETSVKSAERARQKQAAEEERAELRKKLSNLKEDIVRTEKARGHAADALATSEAGISTANRKLRELDAELRTRPLESLADAARRVNARARRGCRRGRAGTPVGRSGRWRG